MKHIVFTFAEPIVAIQRVHNEVFPSGDRTITVFNRNMMYRICNVLRDMHIDCTVTSNSQIVLGEENHIVISASGDEFAIINGKDEMQVLDERQYYEKLFR